MDNKIEEWQRLAVKLQEEHVSTTSIAEMLKKPRTTVRDFLFRYNSMRNAAKADEMYPEAYPNRVDNEIGKDNSRVLIISDMHIPYHHPKLLPFLDGLKLRYNPTRVICIGDELDKHAMSYHDHDPDLASAGDELKRSLPVIKEVYKRFPDIDFLDSNHGSMVYRKAKTNGIPRRYIRSYNDVLEVGAGWKWHMELVIELPDGSKVYFTHGKSAEGIKLSQAMGMSVVQGHYHEKSAVDYWARPGETLFSMQVGCLIDDRSYAFSYNNTNVKRPVISTGLIIDNVPIIELMPQ